MGAMLDRCFTDMILMGSFDIHGFVVIGQGKPPTANVYTFLTVNDMHV